MVKGKFYFKKESKVLVVLEELAEAGVEQQVAEQVTNSYKLRVFYIKAE